MVVHSYLKVICASKNYCYREQLDLTEFLAGIRTKQVRKLIIFSLIPSKIQAIECTYSLIIQGKHSLKCFLIMCSINSIILGNKKVIFCPWKPYGASVQVELDAVQ